MSQKIEFQVSSDFSPGVLSMLPLFYVGWSDSVLSPSEMKIIHQQMDNLDFLTNADKAYLIKWTNPTDPPSAEIFKSWAKAIKSYSDKIPTDKKQSLAELGLQMAQSSMGYKSSEIWNAPETLSALQKVEHALGIDNPFSQGILLDKNTARKSEGSFSVENLGAILDGPFSETKNRMRKLMRDPYFAYQTIRDKEDYRQHILTQLKTLAKQGLSSYAFPKAYGGTDLKGDHIAVFEMLAYHDLSLTVKFGVQFGLFGGAVHGLGTSAHHKKYIQKIINTELLGCFAMTETNHGSDVKGLKTTAIYDPETDELIINTPTPADGKEYIGNAMHSTMGAVFAQLIVNGENHGVHSVLVPLRDEEMNLMPGVTIKDNGYKMGLNGVDNGKIWFDQVRVPRENLLDKYGTITDEGIYASPIENANKRFFTMLGALVAGRISVGLAGLNASKSALTIAVKYALKRRQFAPNDDQDETLLMDYPTHQWRLLPLIAKTYALYFAMMDLNVRYANSDGTDMRQIETDAAGLKAIATWHTTNTIQECREACGGKGYLSENRFTDLKADTDIFTTFEGDNTVLLQLVAKGLLTKFQRSFNDDKFRAVMRFLADKISHTATEYNPAFARNTSKDHLEDPDFIYEAFTYREKKLLMSVSDRMRNYLGKRIDPYMAFLKCQKHLIALSKAYIDRLALKAMYKQIENCDSKSEKAILKKLYTLYGLHTIHVESAFFLENDFMVGSKSKAIRRLVGKICQELRNEAEGLVDAFLIPEELLGAKIILYN